MNFSDPQTLWLNLTNLALGIVVLVCIAMAALAISRGLASNARSRRQTSAEIDRDMKRLASLRVDQLADDHAFDSGNLGITMADGGENFWPFTRKPEKH